MTAIRAILQLFACLVLGVGSAAAQTERDRSVAVGGDIDWSYEHDRAPVRYRAGDLVIAIRGVVSGEDPEFRLVRPVVTVERSGASAVTIEGSDASLTAQHRVSVDRWGGGGLYVMLQSFTGGAHCCNGIQLVIPEGGALRAVELGQWDGDYLDALPSDVDGDGRLDFRFRDNRFLYAFASYADSYAPLQVINVVDGHAVDVSGRPGFRPLFEAALSDQRRACVAPGEDRQVNGACASYVATAARVGRFDAAWAEMLRAYDRNSDWELPGDCRSPQVNSTCPEADRIAFRNYPEALRHFLVINGYIAR